MSGPEATVRRGFAEVDEGQVHYREAGWTVSPARTLVMLHASPGSAKMLEPLICRLGRHRRVVALDCLGNGDSSPPAGVEPSMAYFADAHRRALDSLGVGRFDLYGAHTGANAAAEIAIAAPDRVRSLILDGVSRYTRAQREEMLARYAPEVRIDSAGLHLLWVWQFVRDAYLFWPWYRRDSANRRPVGLPDADDLHDKFVEVMKSCRTYHMPYRAAIAYDKASRLPLVSVPVLLCCSKQDMFGEYFDAITKLLPAAEAVITPGTSTPEATDETVSVFEAFLDAARTDGAS